MNLRARFYVTIGGLVAGLILLSVTIARTLFLSSHSHTEDKLLRENVERVVEAIAAETDAMTTLATDWAVWDDTYRFVQDGNQAYLDSNLTGHTLQDLKIDLIAFVDRSGKLVHGRMLDAGSGEEGGLSGEVREAVGQGGGLLRHATAGSSIAGIMVTEQAPMLLVSRPITQNSGEGPAGGSLVIGRRLGEERLRGIAQRTRVEMALHPIRGTIPAWMASARHGPGGADRPVRIARLDDRTIRGTTCLVDISGRPALELMVGMPRDVYRQGLFNLRYVVVWMLVAGAAVLAVTLWIVDRWVIAPVAASMASLREGVGKVSADGTLSSRLAPRGGDEMAQLAGDINAMLSNLESAQRKSEQQRQELFQAHKLSAVGTLVSGVAHEISNPNNVILLNIESISSFHRETAAVLEERLRADPGFRVGVRPYAEVRDEVAGLIDEIRGAAGRISKFVDELKAFSRRSPEGVLEDVDLNAVVDSAELLLRYPLKRSTGRLEVRKAADLPRIRGSIQRLEQVVVNLLMNACQALRNPAEGIEIRTEHDRAKGRVRLVVRDEGRGVTPDDLRHLTEAFFTTRRAQGGTGLGLSVSLKIVQDHAGEMKFTSELGRGTVVTVEFPVPAEAAA